MLLLFAVLFGSLVAPEGAHAEATEGDRVTVGVAHDHDAVSEQDSDEQKRDAPCKALVHHHHCSVSLAADAEVCAAKVSSAGNLLMPSIAQPMASLAIAPPIEPPAA